LSTVGLDLGLNINATDSLNPFNTRDHFGVEPASGRPQQRVTRSHREIDLSGAETADHDLNLTDQEDRRVDTIFGEKLLFVRDPQWRDARVEGAMGKYDPG
jgi:hypothetical protein